MIPRIALAAVLTLPFAAQAEERVIEAIAPMVAIAELPAADSQGNVVEVGRATGKVYELSESGPVEIGDLACDFTQSVDTATTEQASFATCTVTIADGAPVEAEFTCTGGLGTGCEGALTLSNGGGGDLVFRTADAVYVPTANGSLIQIVYGTAYMPELRLP